MSQNGEVAKIVMAPADPLLSNISLVEVDPSEGVEVVLATNDSHAFVTLVSENRSLPNLVPGDYLSGRSSAGEPFLILLEVVEELGAELEVLGRPAELHQVYQRLHLHAWVRASEVHELRPQEVNVSCQLHPEAQLALQLTLAPDFSEVQVATDLKLSTACQSLLEPE
ncbi:unnamed protein product, partial [Symbiodinium microadriaticum]